MHLRFEWQAEEWREALLLASAGPRRPPKPVMTYAIIGIMSMGAVGEVVQALRSATFSGYGGSLMPMLLFAGAIVLALKVYTRGASRTRQLRPLLPMPTEAQELVLSEAGWRAASADAPEAVRSAVRPWQELCEHRTGERSLILVGPGNTFAALPLRALQGAQTGHLHRLLMRKLHRQR